MGGCEIRIQSPDLAHVSYWTLPAHRRRGFASRAARLLCDFAFVDWGLEIIEAHVALDNIGSRKTALKAGFLEQGRRPDEDLIVYQRTAASSESTPA